MIAQTTFYRVAGLKSLANHWLRLYYTHKVWCRDVNEGLIECGKAYKWFTNYFDSEFATTDRPITRKPVELSLQPYGIITKNSSLVRKKKSHIEKSRKTPITREQDQQPGRK